MSIETRKIADHNRYMANREERLIRQRNYYLNNKQYFVDYKRNRILNERDRLNEIRSHDKDTKNKTQ
jgi:hypothetical protein